MQNILKVNFLILMVFLFADLNAQVNLKIKEGIKAPNFTLQDSNGKSFKLSSFIGKSPVVVYFYPKAGTPGCTKQACGIRDDFGMFKGKNIIVLGISVDSKSDIKKFARKYDLNFPLLSDTNKVVVAKYGVLRDDGKAKRVTFIIDKKGMISKIIEVSNVSTHSKEVFEIASKL
jgi:thioredoxin-dependent peroxiredoxin